MRNRREPKPLNPYSTQPSPACSFLWPKPNSARARRPTLARPVSRTARPPFSLRRAQSAQCFPPPLLFLCGLHPARSRPLTSPRWPNPTSRFLRAQPTQPPRTRRPAWQLFRLRGTTDSTARPRSPATIPPAFHPGCARVTPGL